MAGLLERDWNRDPVRATVRFWAATPFVWGPDDCGVSVLKYVEKRLGRKIKVRPTHTGARTAKLLLFLNGGFVKYGEKIAEELGVEETDSPQRGDVGLIDIPKQGLTACLCLGQHWAAKGDKEILFLDAEPVISWKVA